MPIGILGSLGIVTLIYVAVALVITGLVPYRGLGGDVPIAEGFQGKGMRVVASIIFAGAIVATAETTMILFLGQTRVGFAMARDRLLPGWLGQTHPRFGTPHRLTLEVGAVALLTGLVPIGPLAVGLVVYFLYSRSPSVVARRGGRRGRRLAILAEGKSIAVPQGEPEDPSAGHGRRSAERSRSPGSLGHLRLRGNGALPLVSASSHVLSALSRDRARCSKA